MSPLSRRPVPDPAGPVQESVWDYPRPAIAEPVDARLEVVFAGRTLASTARGVRTLETSHPPTYYFPPDDVDRARLRPNGARRSLCEWKGRARYFDVVDEATGRVAEAACWCYPDPSASFAALAGFLAFYPAAMDACRVDGELVRPQPGGFYGGWITSGVAGPFKGEAGTMGW